MQKKAGPGPPTGTWNGFLRTRLRNPPAEPNYLYRRDAAIRHLAYRTAIEHNVIMPNLSTEDTAAVLELVANVGTSHDVESFARTALEGIYSLIPNIVSVYNELNRLTQTVNSYVFPEIDPVLKTEMDAGFAKHMHEHPLVAHFAKTGDTSARMVSDFMDLETFKQLNVYKECNARLDLETVMVITLPAPPGILIGFSLHRDASGFTERDRNVLNMLGPHLANLYRHVQAHQDGERLRSVLTADGWAVLLVDDRGHPIHVTPHSKQLSASLSSKGALVPELREALRTRISQVRGDGIAAPSSPLTITTDEQKLSVRIVAGVTSPHVLLVRARLEPRDALVAVGLSSREAEVALALLDGGTNDQLASRLGIATGTVRKHLERVFQALGADNRTSAAASIAALVGR
jgi:DNA-binding CsgD family transcriptional regulator